MKKVFLPFLLGALSINFCCASYTETEEEVFQCSRKRMKISSSSVEEQPEKKKKNIDKVDSLSTHFNFVQESDESKYQRASRLLLSGDAVRGSTLYNQALALLKEAATGKHVKAQCSLGEYLLRDSKIYGNQGAIYWLKEAADNGNVTAGKTLGSYLAGQNLLTGEEGAFYWFNKAVLDKEDALESSRTQTQQSYQEFSSSFDQMVLSYQYAEFEI